VFDETNGSQVEQVDLDELDDEEAPCVALRNMSIGDVCSKESEEPTQAQDQPSSSMQASPPTQDEDQAQGDENEDQEEPPQEEDNDQGGDKVDQDKEDDQSQRPPHPRVHQAIQRDDPVNSILDDIHKGVTTRSRVAYFCEHYSFMSSIEPYRVEDALRDLDWVLAMQEQLNNFTRNEVWHLVPRPNQNIVGTKWVFRNKQDEHGVVTRNKARLVAKIYS
jgi:cobalamin biosynthesis protein CobT